jgi:hypothetical protein
MPQYVVTAGDREWFHRCRRAWDFGAVSRRGLVPLRTGVERPIDSADSADEALRRAVREALAVHYFPGMWHWNRAIVDPLVIAAYEQAGGPSEGRELLREYTGWAAGMDGFTPLRVEVDIDVHVRDPVLPDTHLATFDGAAVRYRDRVPLVLLDDAGRHWLGTYRVVKEFAPHDELALDERGVLQCWAWDEIELATTIAGMQYTEMRIEPRSFRRTCVERTVTEKEAASYRLGRAALEMLAAGLVIEPTPAWSHCAKCAFRAPCLAMNRGETPDALLARRYRPRPPDQLEEGRLGGTSWGVGRGAAPPHL